LISGGKLDLLAAHHLNFKKDVVLSLILSVGIGRPGAADSYIYLIKDNEHNRIVGIPRKEQYRNKVLEELLPEKFFKDFIQEHKNWKYSKIPDLIKAYNSRED
jgi:hypothetical protein